MQYSSKRTIGDRFCLSSHAAGFLDPLYSRGLALTMSSLLCLADELLNAIADDDFSTERFEGYDQLVQRSLDRIDDLVSGSYTAWRNFDPLERLGPRLVRVREPEHPASRPRTSAFRRTPRGSSC